MNSLDALDKLSRRDALINLGQVAFIVKERNHYFYALEEILSIAAEVTSNGAEVQNRLHVIKEKCVKALKYRPITRKRAKRK